MNRRKFLKTALGGAVLAAAGPTLWLPRRAKGAWGAPPAGTSSAATLAAGATTQKMLEVFLYGGVAPWETFAVMPEFGKPSDSNYPNQQWWTFQNTAPSVLSTAGICGLGLADDAMLDHFTVDSAGIDVFLGPATLPLRARPDIRSRMRVVVNYHVFEPHEAAIPKALSGRGLGDPKLSGSGAAIGHYFAQLSLEAVPPPQSYVFLAPVVGNDGIEAASSVGALPASSRPLTVKLQSTGQATNALARNNVKGHKQKLDALIAAYRGRYEKLYTRPGHAEPMRSPTLLDYQFATGLMGQNELLQGILTPELLAIGPGEYCGDSNSVNYPADGVRIAASLLQRETDAPRYVCVVDSGLKGASGGGGYDTHSEHIHDSTRNLLNTFTALADNIRAPGEDAPNKIDLDETMVVLTTEFGRSPMIEGDTGRGHWPYGMVSVLIGGSIGPDQAGIVGNFGANGVAENYVTLEEFRAALMLAMGIWPFEAETWAVGNVRAASSEESGALWLKQTVLGHGV
jgi:hypothetical protein